LRSGDDLFRALFGSASIGVEVVDIETGRLVDANAAFQRMLGYRLDELVARPYVEFSHPDDRDRERAAHRRILDGSADTFQLVKRYLRKDGSSVAARVTASVVRDETDGARFCVSMVEDISRELEAENARRAAEERYRLIVETTMEGLWMIDAESRTTFANEAMAEMLGSTAADLEGAHIFEFLDEGGRRQAAAWDERRRRGERVHALVRFVRRDGGTVETILSSSSLFDDEGRYVGALAMVLDNTALLLSQDTLGVRVRQLETIAELGRVILAGAGVEHVFDLARVAVSSALGVDRVVVLPAPLATPVPDAALTGSIEGLDGPYGLLAVYADETRTFTAEDSDFLDSIANLLGSVVRRDQDAELRRRADEHRRALEERLRQAQKLEALGQLASGIAHDFNNLLLVVRGCGELALEKLEGDREGASEDLADLLAAADRGADLTRRLLAFARRQVSNPEVIDLGETVRGMDRLLRRLIGDQVELLTSGPDQPLLVEADRSQLERVLANLAVNARDAMPGGGRLAIDVSIDGGYAVLKVSDDGAGMDEETLAQAFDPFFTTKGDDGTGLGLATVHAIVSQSGGHLAVESDPGRGTTFAISLPLSGVRSAPVPSDLPQGLDSAETILLVEDNPIVRAIVAAMLESYGYTVIAAAGGAEAVAATTRTGSIDLVLTDLVMPGMGGRDTAEAVRALHPAARVLYMSGYADQAVFRGGGRNPGAGFIQKPFNGEALARGVRETLERTAA
jgi:PAS domain S-box-containing protein